MTTATRTRTRATDVRDEPVAAPGHGRTRVRRSVDKFYIDPSLIPDGFHYEWKRHSILNQEDPQYQAELHAGGWRPVPADRHEGLFAPIGTKGAVIIGGQMLMDIPMEFHLQAKEDERRAAVAQHRGSREQFGLNGKTRFEDSPEGHGRRNTYVRTETVQAPAQPKYALAIDED